MKAKSSTISYFFVFLFSISFQIIRAQQNAVTDTGEEVILFKDGTWMYVDESLALPEAEIPVNPEKFLRGEKSTFLIKSAKVDIGFWIDPKKWTFKKATDNEDAEFQLQHKDGDVYGMIITEKVEIPLEALRGIALENGRSAAPDLKIVEEEYRNVNGLDVLFLQMDGTAQGIKFSYYGYYFSNESGTVQYITFSSQNILKSYFSECKDLLNGLFVIEK
jgi:hypothetical protein